MQSRNNANSHSHASLEFIWDVGYPNQAPRNRKINMMKAGIRDCLPPVRNTREPNIVLPRGSIDTHVHVFEPGYRMSPTRGYNPPDSTLTDLKKLHKILGIRSE